MIGTQINIEEHLQYLIEQDKFKVIQYMNQSPKGMYNTNPLLGVTSHILHKARPDILHIIHTSLMNSLSSERVDKKLIL